MRPLLLPTRALLAAVLLAALAGSAAGQTPLGAFATGFSGPFAVTQLADGRVLVVEINANRVTAFAADGTGRAVFATGISTPTGITQLADGRVLVADFGGTVTAFAADGTGRAVFATGLASPFGMRQLADGRVLVAQRGGGVIAFAADGTGRTTFATGLSNPIALTQLADGRVLVAELDGGLVTAFAADGTGRTVFATGLTRPIGVTKLADGRVLVVEQTASQVTAFAADGTGRATFATGLSRPAGVTQLADGRVLVAEESGGRVSAFSTNPTAVAGLYNPSSAQGDGRGYRLLGAPVPSYTVTNLAGLNLVQGIAAGANATTHPAQYANAGANLYTAYNGNGTFTKPTADAVLTPGRGFFWQLYDRDILPANVPASNGTGTSRSYELTGFILQADGTPLTANVQTAFTDNVGAGTDNFQMLANPFARPLAVTGITVSGGTIQGGDVFQAFNPNGGTYQLLMGAARLSVWQGVFAELVPSAAGGAVTVTYSYASTDTNAPPTFYGKDAAATGGPSVRFALAGTLADGTAVADEAAVVRLGAAGQAGWDALDASKLTPPTLAFALVAPVALRDGLATRLAVDTRAADAAASVPLAVTATAGGTFTLAWTAALPDGWSATLRDAATGQTVDMAADSSLAFTLDAGQDWATRFTLDLAPRGATAGEDNDASVFALSAPRPNPTAGRAELTLTLDRAQPVRATLVDALGREVAVLHDGEASGVLTLAVDGGALAPGVYVVRVAGAAHTLARRITVTR